MDQGAHQGKNVVLPFGSYTKTIQNIHCVYVYVCCAVHICVCVYIGKDSDAGKDWRQEEKGTTEDEIVGWHHRFDGHEFEQVLGVGDGPGNLASCSPRGCSLTWLSDWTDTYIYISFVLLKIATKPSLNSVITLKKQRQQELIVKYMELCSSYVVAWMRGGLGGK